MARMLGRWLTGGCGCGKRAKFHQPLGLDCCGHAPDARRFKRIEAREVEQEIADELLDLSSLDWTARTCTLAKTPDSSIPHFPEEDFR